MLYSQSMDAGVAFFVVLFAESLIFRRFMNRKIVKPFPTNRLFWAVVIGIIAGFTLYIPVFLVFNGTPPLELVKKLSPLVLMVPTLVIGAGTVKDISINALPFHEIVGLLLVLPAALVPIHYDLYGFLPQVLIFVAQGLVTGFVIGLVMQISFLFIDEDEDE